MEAASFTAWQILRSKGYKKSWGEYRKGMGHGSDKSKKVSKQEREQTIATALEIHKKFGDGADYGRT